MDITKKREREEELQQQQQKDDNSINKDNQDDNNNNNKRIKQQHNDNNNVDKNNENKNNNNVDNNNDDKNTVDNENNVDNKNNNNNNIAISTEPFLKIWRNKDLRTIILHNVHEIVKFNQIRNNITFTIDEINEAYSLLRAEEEIKQLVITSISDAIKLSLFNKPFVKEVKDETKVEKAANEATKRAANEAVYAFSNRLYSSSTSPTSTLANTINYSLEMATVKAREIPGKEFIKVLLTEAKEFKEEVASIKTLKLTFDATLEKSEYYKEMIGSFTQSISEFLASSSSYQQSIREISTKLSTVFLNNRSTTINPAVFNFKNYFHSFYKLNIWDQVKTTTTTTTPSSHLRKSRSIPFIPLHISKISINCINAVITNTTIPPNAKKVLIGFKIRCIDISAIPKDIEGLILTNRTVLTIPDSTSSFSLSSSPTTNNNNNSNNNNNTNTNNNQHNFESLKKLTIGKKSSNIIRQCGMPALETLLINGLKKGPFQVPPTVKALTFTHNFEEKIIVAIPPSVKYLKYGVNHPYPPDFQNLPNDLRAFDSPKNYNFTKDDAELILSKHQRSLRALGFATNDLTLINNPVIVSRYPRRVKIMYNGIYYTWNNEKSGLIELKLELE